MLAVASGLTGCFTSLADDVQYVPGYGYVVHVRRFKVGGQLDSDRFYVFQTGGEAQKFLEDFRRGGADLSHEPRITSDRQPQEFDYITKHLQPLPRIPTGTIDRVMPPVPTGPAPQ